MASQPYRTSDDLVLEAMSNLGILAAGQAVSPEDFSFISEKLDSIFRKLSALEIVYVADGSNIPGEWFSDLADIVAGECAQKFGGDVAALKAIGLGGPPSPVPMGAGGAAQSLKMQLRGRPTGEPLQTESF